MCKIDIPKLIVRNLLKFLRIWLLQKAKSDPYNISNIQVDK